MDKQTFGAAVVSQTLDNLNSGHADAIGALANIKV